MDRKEIINKIETLSGKIINLKGKEVNLQEAIIYSINHTNSDFFKKYFITEKTIDLEIKKYFGKEATKRKIFKEFDSYGYNLFNKKFRGYKWTTETFREEIKEILDFYNLDFIGEYSSKKITLRCNNCGNVYQTQPNSIKQGKGCLVCKNANANRNKKLLSEVLEQHKKELFKLEGWTFNKNEYTSYTNKINLTHKCGAIKNISLHHFFKGGNSLCIQCESKTMSRGEAIISAILSHNKIKYIREFKFPNSRKRYDFCLIDKKVIIEYHGRQHYIETNWFREGLNFNIKNDRIKLQKAQSEGYNLFVISYKKNTVKLIAEELSKILNTILKVPGEEEIYKYYKKDYKEVLEYYLSHSIEETVKKYSVCSAVIIKEFKNIYGRSKTEYIMGERIKKE